jgi:hypothetical protein
MDRPATKDELLALISEGLADAEVAIRNHPPDTVALYETGKTGLLAGHAKTEDTDWSRQSGFSLAELSLVHQYLAAFAFISAWHHARGDKKRRNNATASPYLLASSLMNCPPEDALHTYLQYERAWLTVLKPRRWWSFWRRV